MLIFWIVLLSVQALLALLCLSAHVRNAVSAFLVHDVTLSIGVPLGRLFFAAIFILAAIPKIKNPQGFALLVAQYQMLPDFSVNFFSLWLPVLELLAGAGLVLTKWQKEFTFIIGGMMLLFIIALAQTLVRDLGIACGCFEIEGAMDKNEAWSSIIRDLALMGPLVWMWLRGSNKYLWDFRKAG